MCILSLYGLVKHVSKRIWLKPMLVALQMDVPEPLDELKPHPTNRRAACEAVMEQAAEYQPMFSFAQGYSLEDTSGGTYFGTATVPVPMPKSAMAAGGFDESFICLLGTRLIICPMQQWYFGCTCALKEISVLTCKRPFD
jgi:hypothetical protein